MWRTLNEEDAKCGGRGMLRTRNVENAERSRRGMWRTRNMENAEHSIRGMWRTQNFLENAERGGQYRMQSSSTEKRIVGGSATGPSVEED
jgi:hypothetical protein